MSLDTSRLLPIDPADAHRLLGQVGDEHVTIAYIGDGHVPTDSLAAPRL